MSTPDRDHLDRPDHGLHTAVAIVDEFEDGLSARWDQLSPKERRHELRRQFDVAMGEIAAADDRRGAEARADAALSALRAELHGTPDGAREHQRLEHQLDVARAGDEP